MGEHARLIFSTAADAVLSEKLCALGVGVPGDIERETFPDGERGLRLASRVADADAFLVGGTGSDPDTLELYDLACALVECGVHALTLVVPYFGYSTQERPSKDGRERHRQDPRTAALVDPSAGRRASVSFWWICTPPGCPSTSRAGSGRCTSARGRSSSRRSARMPRRGCVVASTDAGRAKYVEALANDLRADASFVFKRRDSGGTRVLAVSARVAGQHVMLYDDMVRTGASLLAAAEAYRDAGASRITALATHGVLPGDALGRLERSGLFDRLIVTDTHPRARQLAGGFVEVRSVVPLLASALRAR